MVKRMKKVFPICCCRYCRQYLKQIIVLPSKIMKYHILKISTTRVTVTQTDLKMRTCVFMPSFIQSITSHGVAKCKVSFIVVYNLISVQRKPLSLYGVGMRLADSQFIYCTRITSNIKKLYFLVF